MVQVADRVGTRPAQCTAHVSCYGESFTGPHATRLRLILLILIVLTVDGMTFAGFRSWWAPCNRGGHSVAVPVPRDSPQDVVRTLFAAVNHGDSETVRATLPPEMRWQLETPGPPELPFLTGISYVSNICTAGPAAARPAEPPVLSPLRPSETPPAAHPS